MNGSKASSLGFTLIELVVAVAILAIVVGIAIPAYTEFVVRTNRTEGKATILNAAQGLERCFSRFNSYNNPGCTLVGPLTSTGIVSENDHYLVTAVQLNVGDFRLRAAPQGAQATRDTRCGNLELTHTGLRAVVGGTGTVADCW